MTHAALDPWQWRLSKQTPEAVHRAGAWSLEIGPGLPVFPVSDAEGRSVGTLIGFPIDLEKKRLIKGSWQSKARLSGSFEAYAMEVIWSLGGRFLWVADTPEGQRVYPDSSAQVACVFDPVARLVGSTAYSVLSADEYTTRFDQSRFSRLEVDGEGWFPAGLTAHRGLQRLLPNHYLDLTTFEVRRFWPVKAIGTGSDPEAIVSEIMEVVQAQLEALTHSPKKLGLALTGGHETRMLLACARPYLDKIEMVTVVGGDRHEVDSVLSRRIAKDLGLSHVTLQRRTATVEQRELFIRRGGHCNADSNSRYHPSIWPIAETHNLVGGVGGEVARAFFWKSEDVAGSQFTGSALNARFGLAPDEEVSGALEDWLRGLPPMSAFEIMDLAYLEHRDGAWYASQFCCDPTLVRFAPLLTSRVVELMIKLPEDWKRKNRLGHAVIARLWPELASYPYNSLGRWRDAAVQFQKVASNPSILVKKLRKLMS
jgi:hypothetical protein